MATARAVNVGRMMTRPDAQFQHRIVVRFNPATNRFITCMHGAQVQIQPTRYHAGVVTPLDGGDYLVHQGSGPEDYVVFSAENAETQDRLDQWLGRF